LTIEDKLKQVYLYQCQEVEYIPDLASVKLAGFFCKRDLELILEAMK